MDDNANEGDETGSSDSSSDQQHEQEALTEAAAFYELQHSKEYQRFLELSLETLTYAAEVKWVNVQEQLMKISAMFDQVFAATEEVQIFGQALFQPLEHLEVPVPNFTTPTPVINSLALDRGINSSGRLDLEEVNQQIARLVEESQMLMATSRRLVSKADYLLGRSLALSYYYPSPTLLR